MFVFRSHLIETYICIISYIFQRGRFFIIFLLQFILGLTHIAGEHVLNYNLGDSFYEAMI